MKNVQETNFAQELLCMQSCDLLVHADKNMLTYYRGNETNDCE